MGLLEKMENLVAEINVKVNENKEVVVSSREVATNFERQHSHVLRDIEVIKGQSPRLVFDRMFFESNYKAGTGKNYKEYLMNRDGFTLLTMGFTGAKALNWKLKYIEAFNSMEDSLRLQQNKLPATYKEALKHLLLQVEENEKLEKEIEVMKPKVIFADAVNKSDTSILIGELAKLLKQNGFKIGQNRLFEYLRENGYLIKRKGSDYNMPTQKSMELGLFVIKETEVIHINGKVIISRTTKVTGRGQIYFINKFKGAELQLLEG